MSDLAWAVTVLLPVALVAVVIALLALEVKREHAKAVKDLRSDLLTIAGDIDAIRKEISINGSTAAVFDSITTATRAARGYEL